MNRIDFRLIQWQLAGFCSALLMSVLIVHYSNDIAGQAQSLLDNTEQVLNDTTEKLQRRMEGLQIFQDIRYQLSELNGFAFDKPDKLRWMEYIQDQGNALNLPAMTFSIKARAQDSRFPLSDSRYAVFKTPIEIQAGLVHDQQLLTFIHALKISGLGLFSVERCALSTEKKVFAPGKPNIAAQCFLEWYEFDKIPETMADDWTMGGE